MLRSIVAGGVARGLARRQAAAFSTASMRQADLVQDLYLRELKNYKPRPTKESDSEGQVKQWKPPTPARAPAVEAADEGEVQAYQNQQVELAAASEEGSSADEEDWFEEEEPAAQTSSH